MREIRDTDLPAFLDLRARYKDACGEDFCLFGAPASFHKVRAGIPTEYPGPAWETVVEVLEKCIKAKRVLSGADCSRIRNSSKQFYIDGAIY